MLHSCGSNADELGGFTSGSLRRVFAVVADVARKMGHDDIAPTLGLYEKPQVVDITWK
jgi:hypothetical protein